MQVLVLSLLVACALAVSPPYYPKYFHYSYPGGFTYPYGGPYNPTSQFSKSGGYIGPYASQYHAQDELGQASYGYAYPGHAAAHFRDFAGNQVGSWGFINPDGKDVRVSYTAGTGGYRVLSNDLPVAPVDDSKAPVFEGKAPEPVEDSPEVVAAKEAFFKRFNEEKEAAASRPKRDTSDKAEPEYPKEIKVIVGKTNQFATVLADKQFVDDLKWKSVDLDEDGFPDVAAKDEPVPPPVSPPAKTAVVLPPVPALPAINKPGPGTFVYPTRVVAPGSFVDGVFDLSLSGHYLDPYNPYPYPVYVPYGATPSSPVAAAPAPSADAAPVKVESSRKKRQIPVYSGSNLFRDFVYNSVDLNRDGQPDQAIYSGYPYPYYPYSYQYSNRFYPY